MKSAFLVSILMIVLLSAPASGFDQAQKEEAFSIQGALTAVDAGAKKVAVKTEGGLELTFHTDDTTQIKAGLEVKSLTDLAVEDTVEIDYSYNKNYEKVAHAIRKQSPPAVS